MPRARDQAGRTPIRAWLRRSLVAAALAVGVAAQASAQVVDTGVVVVDPDGHLRIGVGAAGQRDVTSAYDGPHPAITVGDGAGGDGTLRVGAGGEVETTGELVVGTGDADGRVELLDGGRLLTGSAWMPGGSGSPVDAAIELRGLGTEWVNAGALMVREQVSASGSYGNLGINVLGGALLDTGSLELRSQYPWTTKLLVDGPGSTVRADGLSSSSSTANGEIVVSNGGSLDIQGTLAIRDAGYSAWPPNFLLTGAGSTVDAQSFVTGGWGTQSVITDGAHLRADSVDVATQSVVGLEVSGPGTRMDVAGQIHLFPLAGGDPTLDVWNGAVVTSGSAILSAAGTTRVTVDGPTSEWRIAGPLGIGGSGASEVLVSAGGYLSSGDATLGGCATWSGSSAHSCLVSVDGADSRWDGAGAVQVGSTYTAPARIRAGNGAAIDILQTITVTPLGFVEVDDASISAASIDLQGGELLGLGTVAAAVQNGSMVRVGFGPGGSAETGDLHIAGSYAQASAGALDLTLASPLGGPSDRLLVDGNAILGGLLAVSVLPGYEVAYGDRFELVVAHDLVGEFDDVLLPALSGSLVWDLRYLRSPTGGDVLELRAIPEPGTGVLVGLGTLLLGAHCRRLGSPSRLR